MIYPRAAKSLTLCLGLFPCALVYGLTTPLLRCPQATAGAVTALVTISRHLSKPRWPAACAVLGCPQQTPCDLQDQGPSTGFAAEARQHRKTEVSHTQCQKSSRGLVNQRYETHGGLCPNADILKAAPSH